MGKKGGKTTTTTPDPTLLGYRDKYLADAFQQSGQPLQFYGSPGYQQNSPYAGPGQPGYSAPGSRNPFFGPKGGGSNNLGFTPPPVYGEGEDPWVAAAGDPTEFTSTFMNPYEKNVIGGVQGDFDRQRTLVGNRAADFATRAGAFGGSRSAVLEAQGLEGVNRDETNTVAGLRYQGYNDALRYGMDERMFRRGVRQEGINAGRSRFDQAQNYGRSQLGLRGSAVSGVPAGSQSYSPYTWMDTAGLFGNAISGGAKKLAGIP